VCIPAASNTSFERGYDHDPLGLFSGHRPDICHAPRMWKPSNCFTLVGDKFHVTLPYNRTACMVVLLNIPYVLAAAFSALSTHKIRAQHPRAFLKFKRMAWVLASSYTMSCPKYLKSFIRRKRTFEGLLGTYGSHMLPFFLPSKLGLGLNCP